MSKLIKYYIIINALRLNIILLSMPYFKGVSCSEFYDPLQFESRQVREMCDA